MRSLGSSTPASIGSKSASESRLIVLLDPLGFVPCVVCHSSLVISSLEFL